MVPVVVTVWVLLLGNNGYANTPVFDPHQYASMNACMAVKTKLDKLITDSGRRTSCVETQVVIGYKSK